MSNYRTVLTKLWNDKDVLATPKDGKLLFLYLITNKLINNSGVYEIPIATIVHETAIPAGTVKKLFANGSLKNVFYDHENEMVFVKNARRYHTGGNPVKVEKGILNEFSQTSKTPLWNLFIEANPCFKDMFLTVPEPLPKGSLPLPIPTPVLNNNKKEGLKKEVLEVIAYLNERAEKNHRPNQDNCAVIGSRLNEGYTVDQCRTVIDNKMRWKGDQKMDEYLRPITLFQKSKFDGYLNAKPQAAKKKETPGSSKRRQIERLMAEEAESSQPLQLEDGV